MAPAFCSWLSRHRFGLHKCQARTRPQRSRWQRPRTSKCRDHRRRTAVRTAGAGRTVNGTVLATARRPEDTEPGSGHGRTIHWRSGTTSTGILVRRIAKLAVSRFGHIYYDKGTRQEAAAQGKNRATNATRFLPGSTVQRRLCFSSTMPTEQPGCKNVGRQLLPPALLPVLVPSVLDLPPRLLMMDPRARGSARQ